MSKKDTQEGHKKTTSSTPKDVFSYLLMIAMFYVSIVSFLTIIFQYINVLIPDVLDSYARTYQMSMIRNFSSALIVTFPVYILMSWFIGKDLIAHPNKRSLSIRKWLIYLTLFIAAITIIVDLITLVNGLYNGELTSAFMLKAMSVLLVAAGVFGYYFWDLRNEEKKSKIPKMAAISTSILVFITLVSGFFIVGSPQHQRNVRFDEERLNDLQNIQYQVINHWQTKETLPTTLDQLADDISGFRAPRDPQTNQPFVYKKTGDLSFEICATFSTVQTEEEMSKLMHEFPYMDNYGNPVSYNWSHNAEFTCFSRTIDPDKYPPMNR